MKLKDFDFNQLLTKIILIFLTIFSIFSLFAELYNRYQFSSLNIAAYQVALNRFFFCILFLRLFVNIKKILNLSIYIKIISSALLLISFLHLESIIFKNTLYMLVIFLNILLPIENSDSDKKVLSTLFIFWTITFFFISLSLYYSLIFPTGVLFWNIDISFASFFPHRNTMTLFYILSLLLASFLWIKKNIFSWVLFSLPIIYFSYSRTGLLAFSILSTYLIWTSRSKFIKWKIATCLTLIVMTIFSWRNPESSLVPSHIIKEIKSPLVTQKARAFDNGTDIRLGLALQSVELILKNPVWGYGEFPRIKTSDGQTLPPHNFIISNSYAYGLPYMILMLNFLIIIFIKTKKTKRTILLLAFIFANLQPYFDIFTSIDSILFLGLIILPYDDLEETHTVVA